MSRVLQKNPLYGLAAILFTALILLTPGCMHSPYNNQIYASKYSTVAFNGFVKAPNARVEIYVQSWPQGDCAVVGTPTEWELLLTTYSNSTPTVSTRRMRVRGAPSIGVVL